MLKHDTFMAMGEFVSDIKNPTKQEEFFTENNSEIDLKYELYIHYRLLRKKWSAFIRDRLKKNFSNILFITTEFIPEKFITNLQRQYPDKSIQVLIPLFDENKNYEKTQISFEYFLQNRKYTAIIYRIPSFDNGIKIFGIYTKKFSEIKNYKDFYNIKYLSHFSKIARKTAIKLKPDLIHSDNIPFLLGLEYSNRWVSGFPIKFVQCIHDFNMYNNIEPFWAAINLANKKEMKKICRDVFIQKNLALLFNLEYTKKFKKCRGCLSYLYKHYDKYRQTVSTDESTKENVILERLNDRIIKIFPNQDKMFNPILLSMKKANGKAFNSISEQKPDWLNKINKYNYLIKKSEQCSDNKIKHSFDVSDFRTARELNKKYLIREFSEKRIETKFIDLALFTSDEINISGYLDSFYKAPLIFIPINEYTKENDIKTASIAILKLYELQKNVQVVYNIPQNFYSPYLNALFDFFTKQSLFNGRWLKVEGNVNFSQFLAASDIVLIPSGDCLNIENTIYSALKYGCIPIVNSKGVCADIVTDIFDDMNTGCGFKTENIYDYTDDNYIEKYREAYNNAVLKALNFMNNNKSSWNIIIENAMKYDSSWDFETLEKYNNLYEDII